ncbi:MAG TPA: DUF983 domain-containing protein [Gemmatimonadaceae bacterium]|nr:DUF983 domain-containing protein [Gemmatimonadaceae bacterium]
MIDPGATKPPASALTMTGRALLLRCPHCGGRGIWRTFFTMQSRCPVCGIALDRGESEDYWLGAYMFNLVAAELVAVGISVVVIIASWPDVPWNLVWGLSIVLAAAMPILFFPFARNLWLAWDLYFRPREPTDFGGAGVDGAARRPPSTR